jgi:hypothetical protein
MHIKIIASSAFGGIALPNGNASAFGTNFLNKLNYFFIKVP